MLVYLIFGIVATHALFKKFRSNNLLCLNSVFPLATLLSSFANSVRFGQRNSVFIRNRRIVLSFKTTKKLLWLLLRIKIDLIVSLS